MNTTRTYGPSWQRGNWQAASPNAYLGWSHRNARLEMMDLPTYVDSFRQGYETLREAYGSALGGGPPPDQWYGGGYNAGARDASRAEHGGHRSRGHRRQRQEHGHECECRCGHGRHDHEHGHDCDCDCGGHGQRHERGCGHKRNDHEHGHDRDCDCGRHRHRNGHDRGCGGHGHRNERDCGCGCRPQPGCRCECCIQDADIVVYAHCGEVRVVPMEIENDTRKVREDVTVDVTEIRTAGGRTLPWQTLVTPEGPLTLEPCSTTKLEILVHIVCGEADDESRQATEPALAAAEKKRPGKTEQQPSHPDMVNRTLTSGRGAGDLDECVVGYLTVRLGGCVTRPIVVAIAALPDSCDSYRTGCSRSCCC
jgi:hypothetical protein